MTAVAAQPTCQSELDFRQPGLEAHFPRKAGRSSRRPRTRAHRSSRKAVRPQGLTSVCANGLEDPAEDRKPAAKQAEPPGGGEHSGDGNEVADRRGDLAETSVAHSAGRMHEAPSDADPEDAHRD